MGKFAETFLNWQIMQQYLPKIVEGFFLTIQLALAVVVTGIACGLVLALVRARWSTSEGIVAHALYDLVLFLGGALDAGG